MAVSIRILPDPGTVTEPGLYAMSDEAYFADPVPGGSLSQSRAKILLQEGGPAKLIGGALDGLKRHGVPEEAIHLAWVPGAFEIPLIASKMAASGKYDAVISNVTVTEARKKRFDFATYRQDVLGFYVKSTSTITEIKQAADIAGLKIIVGSGTNQEKVLLAWNDENVKKGLQPFTPV